MSILIVIIMAYTFVMTLVVITLYGRDEYRARQSRSSYYNLANRKLKALLGVISLKGQAVAGWLEDYTERDVLDIGLAKTDFPLRFYNQHPWSRIILENKMRAVQKSLREGPLTGEQRSGQKSPSTR